MELLEIIKNRRCIRKFKSKEIEEDKINRIMEAAKWAPSAGNLQARDFILVRNPETKEKIAEAALSQNFISEAPVIIVVCANKKKSSWKYGPRGVELYPIQDAAISAQNILLMAYSLGLGSCWVGAFDEDGLGNILNIPEDVRPVAIIPLGYPDESPIAPPRVSDLHNEIW